MRNTCHIKPWMADGLCLLVACIWGTGFIASQMAINANMSAALIMVMRFVLATAVMFVICLPRLKKLDKETLKSGVIAGVMLFAAFYTQILGQAGTTVSHCAFLTATNVVMVPFIMWICSRKKPKLYTFFIAALTLLGIGVLSFEPGSLSPSFNMGDALSLVCAVFFALHITSLGRATRKTDALLLNLVQLATATVISLVVFLATDIHALSEADMTLGTPAILFLGLFSTCLCYFLQTLAQKYTSPAQAGVLLSTEGLFGSLFSVVLGMEAFSANMAIGGFIILLSVILLEVFSARTSQ